MQQIYGVKVSVLTRGGLAVFCGYELRSGNPYSDVWLKLPEVSRGHSTLKLREGL
ncbi:MAG: hypothetical protein M1475_06460 [Actinobacteria bacterium]|nr:hypothetical protein [Actinomycetota bacterium]